MAEGDRGEGAPSFNYGELADTLRGYGIQVTDTDAEHAYVLVAGYRGLPRPTYRTFEGALRMLRTGLEPSAGPALDLLGVPGIWPREIQAALVLRLQLTAALSERAARLGTKRLERMSRAIREISVELAHRVIPVTRVAHWVSGPHGCVLSVEATTLSEGAWLATKTAKLAAKTGLSQGLGLAAVYEVAGPITGRRRRH